MTGRRRPLPSRSFGLITGAVTAGAVLLSGCGALPGGSGDPREPVTVMTWAPSGASGPDTENMAGMTAMAQAYGRWINARGGIDGHRLRVITCDEQDAWTGAGDCARKAVAEKAVAVVGSYSRHGRAYMAPLEVAGIPYIGGYGASEEEFRSYASYPVTGGQSALLAGTAEQLSHDCDRVSLVRPDTLSGDSQAWLLRTGLKGAGRPAPLDIPATEGATSYDAEAERALSGAGATGGCVTSVLGNRTGTFFDSFRRLAPKGTAVRVASVLGSVGQPLIDRTGGRDSPFEGAYVTGWYPPPGDARWNPMRKVIREQAFGDNRIDPEDTGVQTTWIAYTALTSVIESMHASGITASKLTRALGKGARADTGGLTPPLRWRYQDMIGSRSYPRVVNSEVTFQVVRDGRLVAARKGFVDVTETMAEASATR